MATPLSFRLQTAAKLLRLLARTVLRRISVNNLLPAPSKTITEDYADFWSRLLSDNSLQGCANLEKLLVGCEIIAALDDLELLAA